MPRKRGAEHSPVHQRIPREALLDAKERLSEILLGAALESRKARQGEIGSPAPSQNVVGVGIGERVSRGNATGEECIKIFVRRKYALESMSAKERLPAAFEGIPIDIEEVGTIRASQVNPRSRLRPPFPGCSVGVVSPELPATTGTFGALVRDSRGSYVLSNNHVLAAEDTLPPGGAVFQPGPFDAATSPSNKIATYDRAIPLDVPAPSLDCAVARLIGPGDPRIIVIGAPTGVGTATKDLSVRKFGRSTGLTAGSVSVTDMNFLLTYAKLGTVVLRNQIGIRGINGQPFSDDGDSGALVVDAQTNAAIGLLVGTSRGVTVATDIQRVLAALQVDLVTA